MHSGSEIVPWFGSHRGKCWGLANPCWLGFLKWEKDLEIPLRSFLTSRNMVWLHKRDLTDEHLVRADDGTVFARCVRRVNEQRWPEENFQAVAETQTPKTATLDLLDPPAVPPAGPSAREGDIEEKTTPGSVEDEDQEMQRKETRLSSSSHQKRETWRNTRSHPRETKRDDENARLGVQPEKPRLVWKTSREDTLVPSAGLNPLDTMRTLLQDERACTLEVNALEAKEPVKTRPVLDEPNDVMPTTTERVVCADRSGCHDDGEEKFAAGHRMIQTRWVDK